MLRIFLFTLIYCFIGSISAQVEVCGQLEDYHVEQEESLAIITREKAYLTVVVHLVYRTSIDSISDEQILSQIEVLNEDFNQLNDNFDDTPEIFKDVAANTEIHFCLATKDPNGNPTSGITRTKTNIVGIAQTDSYYQSAQGGADPWDNERYINIWVADYGNSSISGSGTFPGQADPPEKDGIVMSFKFFGRKGVAEQFYPHDLGRICVHEMGHYLGLPHIFGSIGSACDDDDGFNDTPLQENPSFACPDFPLADICTQNNGVMFMNFMDYTDDECMSMFTQEQKNRMWQSLNGPRNKLLESNQDMCLVDTPPVAEKEWTLLPNPAIQDVQISDSFFSNENFYLYDINGKLCFWTQVNSAEKTINISSLYPGIYFARYRQSLKKLIIL